MPNLLPDNSLFNSGNIYVKLILYSLQIIVIKRTVINITKTFIFLFARIFVFRIWCRPISSFYRLSNFSIELPSKGSDEKWRFESKDDGIRRDWTKIQAKTEFDPHDRATWQPGRGWPSRAIRETIESSISARWSAVRPSLSIIIRSALYASGTFSLSLCFPFVSAFDHVHFTQRFQFRSFCNSKFRFPNIFWLRIIISMTDENLVVDDESRRVLNYIQYSAKWGEN